MKHLIVARILLSLLCVIQGFATVAIDLNRTHATNPIWPGHARFHLVWQTFTVVLLSIVELALTWASTPYEAQGFYLACLLTGMSPLGFLAAVICRKTFGGTLSDINGIRPTRFAIFGRPLSVDLNLAAVAAALLALATILAIYRR